MVIVGANAAHRKEDDEIFGVQDYAAIARGCRERNAAFSQRRFRQAER